MAVLDYEGLNTRSNNIARSELVKYLTKIGCRETRHTGSHKIFQNAAGSIMMVPIGGHKPDVPDSLRRHTLDFVNEHLAAQEHHQTHEAPRSIHIEDESAIEEAGLTVTALSQENRTITLADSAYPEIAVVVHLHDDLAVTDSHIKSAAAERDALLATYQDQLATLKHAHHVQRMMVDGHPQLQIISRSSGRMKTGTQAIMVPTLDDCATTSALDEAREHALQEMRAYAISLQPVAVEQAPQRDENVRSAEFNAIKKEMAHVGMMVSVKHTSSGQAVYWCGYMPNTIPAIAERFTVGEMVKMSLQEMQKKNPALARLHDNDSLQSMAEEYAHDEPSLMTIHNTVSGDVPSDEALQELRSKLADYTEMKQMVTQLYESQANLRVHHKSDGATHYSFPAQKLPKDQKPLGVLMWGNIDFVEKPPEQAFAHSTIDPVVLNDMHTIHHLRILCGMRSYEQALISALGGISIYPVYVQDEAGMRSLSIRNVQQKQLYAMPVTADNVENYLRQFGHLTKSLYDQTVPQYLASYGWVKAQDDEAQTLFTHRDYPDCQISIPHFMQNKLNHNEVLDGIRKAVEIVNVRRKHIAENDIATQYAECREALIALGFSAYSNGTHKLLPPHNVSLKGLVLRDADAAQVNQPALKVIQQELAAAHALHEKQSSVLHHVAKALGDKAVLHDTGITLMLPDKQGRMMPHEIHYALSRDGAPSAFFTAADMKRLHAVLDMHADLSHAGRYLAKTSTSSHMGK